MSSPPENTRPSLFSALSPVSVLIVCLALTVLLWRGSVLFTQKSNNDYFEALVADSEQMILSRFQLYEQALLGGRGFIRGSAHVSRDDWHHYVYGLSVKEGLPGILGIGYINFVPSRDLPDFLESTRRDGAPTFTNYPETPSDNKYIITYIEPEDVNKKAVGLDISFETCRREAAETSWRTGKPTLTCKVELVQDNQKKPGFLLLVPVYAHHHGQDDISELRGWVYAPFVGQAFLTGITEVDRDQLSLAVYDGSSMDDASLIYKSDNAPFLPDKYKQYQHKHVISIAGRDWTLLWRPSAGFIPRASENIVYAVLLMGVVFSFFISIFVWFITSSADNIRRQVKIRTRELEEATRAKSDFLARMSHEIRTPMNGILGYVDILKHTSITNFQRTKLDKLEMASRTLLAIINDILDWSKIEAGKMIIEYRPFNLSETLSICMDMVRADAEAKGLEFTMNVPPDCPAFFVGDQYRIQQIFLNLLGNAVKFTEKGFVRLNANYVDGQLVVDVSDSGIGIAKDKQDSVFESFMQEDAGMTRRFGGTGLGLPICKQLVTAMKGEILIDSDKGIGTRFTVTLPLEVSDVKPVKKEAEPVSVSSSVHTILLVEDTPMNQEITRAMLERYGHTVDVVGNGRDAIQAVQDKKYDLVLMDIQMPDMDGIQATQEIRETLGMDSMMLPIIALTAQTLPQDVAKFFEVGIDDYISKPVKAVDLIAKINTVLDGGDEFAPGAAFSDNLAVHDYKLFDREQYESIAAILGDEKGREIYTSFREDADSRMKEFCSGTLPRQSVYTHLHSMASMAGNMGFSRMEAECRRLNEVLPTLTDAVLNEDLYALQVLYQQSCTAYNQCYPEGVSPAGTSIV